MLFHTFYKCDDYLLLAGQAPAVVDWLSFNKTKSDATAQLPYRVFTVTPNKAYRWKATSKVLEINNSLTNINHTGKYHPKYYQVVIGRRLSWPTMPWRLFHQFSIFLVCLHLERRCFSRPRILTVSAFLPVWTLRSEERRVGKECRSRGSP